MLQPFHLAIPVHNLETARHFYGHILGCCEGRSDDSWVDFNFFGHQLVIHKTDNLVPIAEKPTNAVEHHNVPIPHFGIVLTEQDWTTLAERLGTHGISFVIEPSIRFQGQVGEQNTMFFLDPSGNALEFKSFKNIGQLFAK